MEVSIIIVNYNAKDLVLKCIDSIFLKTVGLHYEVIVIDNCSTDGSVDLLSQNNRIRLIKQDANLGFGLANNEGFKIAKGKYVFCLNPDTLLLNNAIKILYDFMENRSEVGICGGNLYDIDMNPTHSYRMMLPSIWWELDCHLDHIYTNFRWGQNSEFNHTDNPLQVGYITGADMMVRKDVIDRVGGFSKYFFMYYEDCELTWRIRKAGYKVYSVPSAHIQHLEGKSFKLNDYTKKQKFSIQSLLLYRKLCYSSMSLFLIKNIFLLKSMLSNNDMIKYKKEIIRTINNIEV